MSSEPILQVGEISTFWIPKVLLALKQICTPPTKIQHTSLKPLKAPDVF